MVAQINLKKLTGIQIESEVISSSNFQEKINSLGAEKLAFAGQNYKGTLDNSNSTLELYLEGPENYFKIGGIKVKNAGTHTLSDDAKDATIAIDVSHLNLIEKDSDWLTTQLDLKGLTAANSSLKFGEWNDYDLTDKSYVDIIFG